MKRLAGVTRDFFMDVRGATAPEYALVAVFVAGVLIATMFALGVDVLALYQSVADSWPT